MKMLKYYLKKKLKNDANNTDCLDLLAEVLTGLDDVKGAKKLLEKSIKLSPETNPYKYMSLGQLQSDHQYRIALQCYEKGIQLFLSKLSIMKEESNQSVKGSLASAYSAIAELYMKSDLCYESNAEEICEASLKEALFYSPDSFDANLQLSNLRIIRKKDDEASIYMDKIYSSVLNHLDDADDFCLPDQDVMLNLSRNYAEIGEYAKAIKLLDILLKYNDEDLECLYLLSFNHFTIKNYKHAGKCLKLFYKAANKTKNKTEEMLDCEAAANELSVELEKIKSEKGELINNTAEENEEEEEKEETSNDMNID